MTIEKLSRDVFLLLAEIAVADGTTHAAEVEALVRAAKAEGLDEADLAAIEAAANTHRAVDVKLDTLAVEDRLFVYAIAYWVSRIDDEMTDAEDAVLTKLGGRLALGDEARMGAEGLVDEVAAMAPGERPDKFDLAALRRALGDRLASLAT